MTDHMFTLMLDGSPFVGGLTRSNNPEIQSAMNDIINDFNSRTHVYGPDHVLYDANDFARACDAGITVHLERRL